MTAPDLVTVYPLEPYVVRVVFRDSETRDVDIEPLLESPVFRPVRDRSEFERVFIDQQTGAVAWPCGADLDPDVIYGVAPPSGEPSARVTTPQVA